MKFGPSRGNPLIIFENFIKDFGLLLIAVIIAFFKGPEILFSNIPVLIIVFLNPIAALNKYLFTRYSIDDEKMTIQSGLFVKKTMEIPLKVITTVDLSQNLLFQLFHVYKIKADNSSQTNDTAKQAEIVLALKETSALYVKKLLEASTQVEETEEERLLQKLESNQPAISCSLMDFIILGVLQSKLVYFITIISAVGGGGGYISKFVSEQFKVSKLLEDFFHLFSPVLAVIILFLVTYLLSLFTSVLMTAIRYYNYTVLNREDSLQVQYGLFTKKSYTLMKDKISGVNIKQSILMRILGYCSVEVFIIGYGDKSEGSEKEISLLYPVARLSQVNPVLVHLLPDMTFDRAYHKKIKGSLRYYFYCFRMILAIVILLGTTIAFAVVKNIPEPAAVAALAASLIFLALIVVSVFLEYRNSGIYANQKVVAICKGCFSLNMIFIKAKKLESITQHASVWKEKRGFTNIKLGFLAPIRVANMNARNITCQDYQEIQKIMSY